MHSQVKKYFSVFFLLLFLFPIVEKVVHDLEHQDEIRCTAADKHFHNLEHTCAICEFTNCDSVNPVALNFCLNISLQAFLFLPFNESKNTLTSFQLLPARAPPIA